MVSRSPKRVSWGAIPEGSSTGPAPFVIKKMNARGNRKIEALHRPAELPMVKRRTHLRVELRFDVRATPQKGAADGIRRAATPVVPA